MINGTQNTSAELVDRGVQLLRDYLADPRTRLLEELAPIIVQLRGLHHLSDGRPDWSGRSTAYRQAMADLYARAKVPPEDLDTVQQAIRYHVGNLLREEAVPAELRDVGLDPRSPKTRLTEARQAMQAQKAMSAPPQDIARLTLYALWLLSYIDTDAIPELDGDRAASSRQALEQIQVRSAELLAKLRGWQAPTGGAEAGKHRRGRRGGHR